MTACDEDVFRSRAADNGQAVGSYGPGADPGVGEGRPVDGWQEILCGAHDRVDSAVIERIVSGPELHVAR